MIPFLKEPEKVNPGTQAAIGLGYQMLAAMAIFVGGGYYLDRRRGGGHLFTLIGVGLAFLYGGYEVWKLVRMMNREEEERQQRLRRPPDSEPKA